MRTRNRSLDAGPACWPVGPVRAPIHDGRLEIRRDEVQRVVAPAGTAEGGELYVDGRR